ncbi:MAG: pseudouridine synthase [Gammaproteobacteria bacterium]|nr:MAG: pseudouridine synthase [Gammaproteobacteria bacterium]
MKKQSIIQTIEQLNRLLKTCQLWSAEQPTPQQLASSEPFCVDTMTFEQWLQWVLIPKLTAVVNDPHFNGLPHRSDIHAMATYVFEKYEQDTDDISRVIKRLDQLLNDYKQQTIH